MIDLCVVSYNTQELLERLVTTLWGSVEHIYDRPWRLHIADNGSSDTTKHWLEEHPDLYDNVVYNTNVGYAKACNQLAASTDGDVIALLNADVWFTDADIRAIGKVFDTHSEVSILGPKQRDEHGRITHAGIFGSNTKPKHRGWKEFDASDQLYRDRSEALTVSGSAYFIRRTTWDTLTQCNIYRAHYPMARGAFLETEHWYEETWCSYHARAHGFKIFYDGTISMGHSWHASSPLNGFADQKWQISQAMFRKTCALHNINCD